jgi:hypothetical protein
MTNIYSKKKIITVYVQEFIPTCIIFGLNSMASSGNENISLKRKLSGMTWTLLLA